jgi:hypothetical protein
MKRLEPLVVIHNYGWVGKFLDFFLEQRFIASLILVLISVLSLSLFLWSETTEERDHLKDVGCSWEDGIKIDCREIE